MQKAHAPYSKFPAGAALKTSHGRAYTGCNVGNGWYPQGGCAEPPARGALGRGGGGRITEIAVVGEKMPKIMPCGGCRQRLAEFAAEDAKLHLCDANGVVETVPFVDIFPRAFGLERRK